MAAIKTVREIAMERQHECSKIVSQRFLPAVRIVYGQTHAGARPEAIGTCFLLRINEKRFLVTAAHVIDQNETWPTLYVGGETDLVPIEGEFSSSPKPSNDRNKDRYDFAFLELPPQYCQALGAVSYIEENQISHNRGTASGRFYMVMGYPISKNKKVDVKARTLRPAPWTYEDTVREFPELARKLGVSGRDHLFLRFDKHSGNYSGQKVTSTSPRGVSGGAVIDLGLPDPGKVKPGTPCVGLLAGIFIEYHRQHKAMVGVKIQVALQHIRKFAGLPE